MSRFVLCAHCGGTGQRVNPGHHRCPQCARVLPATEFYTHPGRFRDSWCKRCRRDKARRRYYAGKRAAEAARGLRVAR